MGLVVAGFCAGSATIQKPDAPSASPGISNSVYLGFAHQLEKELSQGRSDTFQDAFDADALLDISLSGIKASESTMRSFRTGFKSGFRKQWEHAFAEVNNYKLLRLTETNGECHALFRVLIESGGMNYHDLTLKPMGKGVRIVDMYIALLGEPLSVTVRRVALPVFAEQEKSFVQRLLSEEQDSVKYQSELADLIKFSRDGKSAEVLATYKKLPASLQREKFVLIHRIKAAQNIDEKDYRAAIDLWAASYPKDMSLPLVMIDGFTLKKQYAKAIESIDKLDKLIGGDPYLKVQRAYEYMLLEQYDKASAQAALAVSEEPTLAQGYDCLLSISLQRKDYKETARQLASAEKALRVNLSKIVDDSEEYAGFRKSPAYKDWKSGKAQ